MSIESDSREIHKIILMVYVCELTDFVKNKDSIVSGISRALFLWRHYQRCKSTGILSKVWGVNSEIYRMITEMKGSFWYVDKGRGMTKCRRGPRHSKEKKVGVISTKTNLGSDRYLGRN